MWFFIKLINDKNVFIYLQLVTYLKVTFFLCVKQYNSGTQIASRADSLILNLDRYKYIVFVLLYVFSNNIQKCKGLFQ